MKKLNLIKNNYGGKLIVFEGIDGSGKTTLIKNLQQYLENKGYKTVYLKMPSDRMRNLKVFNEYDNSKDNTTRSTINLTNLTIMVSGDRLIQQDETIITALKDNKIVLCDRYCFTGYVRCNSPIIAKICERFIEPNLTFVCDCNVKTAKQRVFLRQNEKNNYYDIEDVKKQRKNFLLLAEKNGFKVINTDNSKAYCENIIAEIIENIL